MHHSRIASVVIALAFASPALGRSFTSLGGVPGGEKGVWARSMSADGRTVLVSSGAQFGLWNVDTGWRPVPVISTEGDGALPWYMSGDASTLIGSFSNVFDLVGFRWREETGMDRFGRLEPEAREHAWVADVSYDGGVVGGEAEARDCLPRAFRWSQETGIVDLGSLRTGGYSSAVAISDDGTVITGTTEPEADTGIWLEPFRWTEETGMVGLGLLPNSFFAQAWGISGDGHVIFGACEIGRPYPQPTQRGFLWTIETGMVEVARPDGWDESIVFGSSFDASVLVGSATRRNEFNERESRQVLWTDGVPAYLDDILRDAGAYGFEGWSFWHVYGISADGRTLFGNGRNAAGNFEAWIATIPTPGSAAVGMIGMAVLGCRGRRVRGW